MEVAFPVCFSVCFVAGEKTELAYHWKDDGGRDGRVRDEGDVEDWGAVDDGVDGFDIVGC